MDENDIMDVQQTSETGSDDNITDTSADPVGAVEVVEMTEEEVMLLADGDTLSDIAYGTISDTYLDYFEGIIQKLQPDQHYVVYKSGDYSYVLAYGEEIEESSGYFVGSCDYVQIYRESTSNYNSNWYVSHSTGTLDLSTSLMFVYSDLGNHSTLERGFSSLEALCLLFAVGFAVVYSVCHDIFDYVLGHLRR